jgi:hypothetical protein
MSEAEEAEWFYAVDGQQGGPVSLEQLRRMIEEGAVGARDLVWRDGMGEWMASKKVAELWAAEPAATPPPPVPPPVISSPPPPASVLESRVAPRQKLPVETQKFAAQYRQTAASPSAGVTSGWAVAAFAVGLMGIFILPAPFAVVFAVLAFREIRRDPGKRGMVLAIIGLVLGVAGSILLFLVCLGFILGDQSKKPSPGTTHPANAHSTAHPSAIFSSVVA